MTWRSERPGRCRDGAGIPPLQTASAAIAARRRRLALLPALHGLQGPLQEQRRRAVLEELRGDPKAEKGTGEGIGEEGNGEEGKGGGKEVKKGRGEEGERGNRGRAEEGEGGRRGGGNIKKGKGGRRGRKGEEGRRGRGKGEEGEGGKKEGEGGKGGRGKKGKGGRREGGYKKGEREGKGKRDPAAPVPVVRDDLHLPVREDAHAKGGLAGRRAGLLRRASIRAAREGCYFLAELSGSQDCR